MTKKKLHIKKGDTVMVISGDDRGKQGRVLDVNPEKHHAIVEGIAIVAKHTRPNPKNTKGGIVKKESPVQVSNLMLIDNTGKPTRIGKKTDDKTGKTSRVSKKSGEVIK